MIPKNLKQYANLFGEYTELRAQENKSIQITIVNGDIVTNLKQKKSGISARVNQDGYWGFASNPLFQEKEIRNVIARATANALFLSGKGKTKDIRLPVRNGSLWHDFSTPNALKPQSDIIEFLMRLDEYIKTHCKDLSSRVILLRTLDMEKSLLTSEGSTAYSLIPKSLIYSGMTITKDGAPIELWENFGGLGQFEDVFKFPPELFAGIDAQYAHLQAKAAGAYAKAGIQEVILDADITGVLAHEAIGHTTEADLVLGGSVAGDLLDKSVASELITLVDFANTAFGRVCPVPVFMDDEGTTAEDCVIIEAGVLKRFMHNKETAGLFQHELTGNARASEYSDEPLIRMRNTAILPGKSKLEAMIASIDDGYYLMKANNGQADWTSEFMFGIVQGYEIKQGKIGKAIRDVTISGIAIDVLKSVTMVSDHLMWTCWGMCGKKQSIPVGMGGPAIKCKVNIGGK